MGSQGTYMGAGQATAAATVFSGALLRRQSGFVWCHGDKRADEGSCCYLALALLTAEQ